MRKRATISYFFSFLLTYVFVREEKQFHLWSCFKNKCLAKKKKLLWVIPNRPYILIRETTNIHERHSDLKGRQVRQVSQMVSVLLLSKRDVAQLCITYVCLTERPFLAIKVCSYPISLILFWALMPSVK